MTITNDNTALCKSIQIVSNLVNALFRIQRHPFIHPFFLPSSQLPPSSLSANYLPTDNRSRYDPHTVVDVSDTVRATADCRANTRTATGRSEQIQSSTANGALYEYLSGWPQQLVIRHPISRMRINRIPSRDQLMVCGLYRTTYLHTYLSYSNKAHDKDKFI